MKKGIVLALVTCLVSIGVTAAMASAQGTDDVKAPAKPVDAAGKPADAAATNAPALEVPYPTGFRDWKHVKSMLIHSDKHPLFTAFAGIHHIYVNGKALKGLKSGKGVYADGSVFAFDLLESPESTGAYTEGKRKFVAVMHKNTKKFERSGGWGWQAWDGGDKTKPVVATLAEQKVCANCHMDGAAKGRVWAQMRD